MKILEIIKNKLRNFIFISKDNNDCQKEIISNIDVVKDDIKSFLDIDYGAIIWADRYNNEEEKMRIPVGHRNGPYVVVGRTENKLLCFYATGEKPKDRYSKNNVIVLEPFFIEIHWVRKRTFIQIR